MTDMLIDEAVSVGAPAYNAGDIALCAEIYKVVAERLLAEHRRELTPEVARDLEVVLQNDRALPGGGARSGGKGSPIDRLAWSYRRAFDAHLDRRPQTLMKQQGVTRPIREVVAQTIAQGAPAYNRGDMVGCVNAYSATARSLVERTDLDTSARLALTAALQQCQKSADVNANAWALRRALDAASVSSAVGSTPASSQRDAPSSGGGALIRDFTSGDGIAVRASVVNDTVMGGGSSSSVSLTGNGMLFEGNVTKRGGGGFASVRFDPADRAAFARVLTKGTGIIVSTNRICGGSVWKFQIMEGSDGTSWQADFNAPQSEQGSVQRIPFSSLHPTWRGRPQGRPGLTSEALRNARSFGFMMSFLSADGGNNNGFEDGPFALNILRVEVY